MSFDPTTVANYGIGVAALFILYKLYSQSQTAIAGELAKHTAILQQIADSLRVVIKA